MPGLPMFGHGQIEGFAEKYGMEYRRAYCDETPDQWLVERHEREIFPLLHKRYLFAGVDNFLLYDVFTPEGHVDENVFAYSNSYGDERGAGGLSQQIRRHARLDSHLGGVCGEDRAMATRRCWCSAN